MEWETTANTTSEESQCLNTCMNITAESEEGKCWSGSGHRGPLASFDLGNAIKLQGTFEVVQQCCFLSPLLLVLGLPYTAMEESE